MKLDTTSFVKSSERTLDILEFVANATEPPGFSQLRIGLGIPRSSLFHLLNTLINRRYLEQQESGGYALGERVRQLGGVVAGPSLQTLVTPVLARLSGELNETSGFYVQVDDAVETIASVSGTQALTFTMKVGERAPLYAVSAGKIVLAHMPTDKLDAYLERVVFERITARTLDSRQKLAEQIEVARRDNFAYSHEEFTPGITGIATGIVHGKRFLGAINLAIPTARFDAAQTIRFRQELSATASALESILLAYRSNSDYGRNS